MRIRRKDLEQLLMQTGVYRKTKGRTGVGLFYEFDCLCRHHTTGEEMVVYIPLRVEPEWAGTVRHCVLERIKFEQKFEYVGEGLPTRFHPAASAVVHFRLQGRTLLRDADTAVHLA